MALETKTKSDGNGLLEIKNNNNNNTRRIIEFHQSKKTHFLGFTHNNNNSTTSTPAAAGFEPEIYFGITFRRIGAGLQNLGNTCFLNSVLQCLTYTEPFAAYLHTGNHKSSCHTSGFCALCSIQNHVKRALQSTGRILAPKDLVMNLRCISRNFRNARQEDAHEYMVNLLESMHKCCLPSGVPSESPSAYEKSLVHKIFGGRLRSQVKCMQCSYSSNTFDPFLDLSLEIMKADSLRKALTHFTAFEQLDGGERQYQCQRCKKKVKALKQLTVHKAPYVLSIHLKRFGSHVSGQKIDKKVEFGPTLDMKPFVSGSYEGDLKYTLYGVLVHAGWSTHSGHYYCFVRTSSGMWHSLDDNRVVQVSERTVLQQKAYMLFYVRDRRNLAPKRPVDCKENIYIVPSVINNREHRSPVKLNKAVQNGPIATGLRPTDLSKESQLKKSSIVKCTTGLVMAEDSSLLKGPMTQSPSKALVEHDVKQSVNGPSVGEVHPQSITSSIEGSNPISYPTVACSGAKKKLECSHQGSNPVAALPSSSGSQSSGPECLAINNVTNANGIIMNNGMSNTEPQKKVDNLKSEESISARSFNQSGPDSNENGGERDSIGHSFHKAKDNRLISKKTRLSEPCTKSCTRNGCVQKEKAIGRHHKPQNVLRPKKKILKLRIASIQLGSRFMKASLNLYKKKKQKRTTRRSLELKSLVQERLEYASSSGGLEPTTSEKAKMTDLVSTHIKRRHKKSSSEKGSSSRAAEDVRTFEEESAINVTEGGLREGIYLSNAVLASNEPPQKCSSSTSEEKLLNPKEANTSEGKTGSSENGLMGTRTRGLEEFTVARWDETESSPSQHLGSKAGQSISIGYVPDEWDEEYDRGKRKKARNPKDSFDGSNLFQEIATKKAKLKKGEEHQSTKSGKRKKVKNPNPSEKLQQRRHDLKRQK